MIYDLIVVGLGAMGSAALYQAARRGARVLGIDRYHPPHTLGSTHAETRITRLAVGEGAIYWPLVRRSHAIWQELELMSDRQLLLQSGGYIITPAHPLPDQHSHWDDFVERTAAVAVQAGVPFERRTAAAVHAHLPQILINDDEQAGYEASGGVVLCEQALEVQLTLAQSLGAAVQFNEPVVDLQFGADAITVVTEHATYRAAKAIVAAGAWIGDFLPDRDKRLLRVTRQVVYWFEAQHPEQFTTDRFPFLIWLGKHAADYLCAFPTPPGGVGGVKLMTEQFVTAAAAATVARRVTQQEIARFYSDFVVRRLAGITPNCVAATVCLYTNTPDDHFIIDYHPHSERVLIASPCSGHGFKHSAAIGEALVQLALNNASDLDLSPFRLARFD